VTKNDRTSLAHAPRSSNLQTKHQGVARKSVTHSRGSPRRSFRWKARTFDALYQVEKDHDRKVKVNRIAEVAVAWGLAFLQTLTPQLRARILGVKGEKVLTFEEREKLRAELEKKLGSLTGAFRLNDRLAFALPTSAKQVIRQEAERAHRSMSAIARERVILQEAG